MDPIEVEVVEIDGKAPPPAVSASGGPGLSPYGAARESGSGSGAAWQHWPGRVRTIRPFWWPVLVVVVVVVLALLLTVGLAVALVYMVLRAVVRLLRALFG